MFLYSYLQKNFFMMVIIGNHLLIYEINNQNLIKTRTRLINFNKLLSRFLLQKKTIIF